jgi:hypothetical protein
VRNRQISAAKELNMNAYFLALIILLSATDAFAQTELNKN